ncbi:hypothetical protein [Streptomyces sp. CBG9]|uniref:hypothetical protein n=1 Tax=Streptomyces sp. CBG9 TaxID=2762622 RepID=UPI0016469D11|nr:hypothetical protein [Streptomyces sp. CBG9]
MAFLRKSMPLAELAEHAEKTGKETTPRAYDAATGGWTRPVKDKPVPGAGRGNGGRLRRGER